MLPQCRLVSQFLQLTAPLPPPGFNVGMLLAWKSSICVSRLRRVLFLTLSEALRCLFGERQPGCLVPFTEDWLPSGYSTRETWSLPPPVVLPFSSQRTGEHQGFWSPPWLRSISLSLGLCSHVQFIESNRFFFFTPMELSGMSTVLRGITLLLQIKTFFSSVGDFSPQLAMKIGVNYLL